MIPMIIEMSCHLGFKLHQSIMESGCIEDIRVVFGKGRDGKRGGVCI